MSASTRRRAGDDPAEQARWRRIWTGDGVRQPALLERALAVAPPHRPWGCW